MAQDDATKSNWDVTKDDGHTVGNLVGESVGGASGIATGAAIGAIGGPVGSVIGALAGAVGGWWAGRGISETAGNWGESDDTHYREHYRLTPRRTAARASDAAAVGASGAASTAGDDYDSVRPAYQLGHYASRNPDYANRSFDDVEGDLRRGWTSDVSARHGDWDSVRPYARSAYERGRMGGVGAAAGAAAGGVAGAVGNVADRVADKVDDLKDRVDGNPASRPGPDATDSARRLS